MQFLCLGGGGRICREAVLDLIKFSRATRVTVADVNEAAAREVAGLVDDPRVDWLRLDIRDHGSAVAQMRGYDVVMDGTTIGLNGLSAARIAEAGCHGINLNGFGEEDAADSVFRSHGKSFVPGFGMTPGTTQMMAMLAASAMDTVDSARVSHGAYRPIAFSASITETTTYEYDPLLQSRVVFEDGEFKQVPPFARPREISLPEPYGTAIQYIIPHAETKTLAKNLAHKGIRLIEVRGTWPQPNMQLIRALYDWGFLRNDKITMKGAEFGIMEAIGAPHRPVPVSVPLCSLLLLALAAGCSVATRSASHAPPQLATPTQWPGTQADGRFRLPNQWFLDPVGRHIPLGDFPSSMAIDRSGRHAAVLHCGHGIHEIAIVDLKSEQLSARVAIEEGFYGVAFSPEGHQLFASGAGQEVVLAWDFEDGLLCRPRRLTLRSAKERGIPAGLAVAPDGRTLYVANVFGQSVNALDLQRPEVAPRELMLGPRSAAPAADDQDPWRDIEDEAITKRARALLEVLNTEAPTPPTMLRRYGR